MQTTPHADAARRARSAAEPELLAEYRFEDLALIAGVAHDGEALWCADPRHQRLLRIDPDTGRVLRVLTGMHVGSGTAYDGEHLWQVGNGDIQKLDVQTGEVLARIPVPAEGFISGMAWGNGALWVGHFESRRIFELDPATGAIRREVKSERLVTGITWMDGELWHGAMDETKPGARRPELLRLDARSGATLDRLTLPPGIAVSGMTNDGERFWCGDCDEGQLRAFRARGKRQGRR